MFAQVSMDACAHHSHLDHLGSNSSNTGSLGHQEEHGVLLPDRAL